MSLLNLVCGLLLARRAPRDRWWMSRSRLNLNEFEPRVTPADLTIPVTNTNNAGPGSLYDALRRANEEGGANDRFIIDFNDDLTGTISISQALPNVNHRVISILGPGKEKVIVQRDPLTPAKFRIFTATGGSENLEISGLTIRGGKVAAAGGSQGVSDG